MLELDLSPLESRHIGPENGLELEAELRAWQGELDRAEQALKTRARNPEAMLGWIRQPEDTETAREILRYVEGLTWVKDVVVLGIGGSALGAKALISALRPEAPVHLVDNVDPAPVKALLSRLDPRTTLVVAISKSGATAETLAAYLIFRRWLLDALGEDWRQHVAIVTDPEKGPLRAHARAEGLAAFDVPPDVGGRFSVFTPVGLLPLALAGVDLMQLLMGARAAAHRLDNARKSALVLFLLERYRGKRIHVLMPYGTRLALVADWFSQLHAESLGKAYDRKGARVHVGPTPLKAVGATDQHSLLQLFREGPNDKAFIFVLPRDLGEDLPMPEDPGLTAADYLFGKGLGELLLAEAEGTRRALTEARRPQYAIWLPGINEAALGELLQTLMWQTALLGELYGVNAFDQPGVELAKRYTFALMGRKGFEDLLEEG